MFLPINYCVLKIIFTIIYFEKQSSINHNDSGLKYLYTSKITDNKSYTCGLQVIYNYYQLFYTLHRRSTMYHLHKYIQMCTLKIIIIIMIIRQFNVKRVI